MNTNIIDFYRKIKCFLKDSKQEILTSVIIILVGISSFSLGVLSTKSESPNIIIRNGNEAALGSIVQKLNTTTSENNAIEKGNSVEIGNDSGGERIVASKNGTKYYLTSCAGSKRILEKNKVYFKSFEDARSKGLTPAANCKGLK